MKKIKRALCLTLTFALLVLALGGCAKEEALSTTEPDQKEENTVPADKPVEDEIEPEEAPTEVVIDNFKGQTTYTEVPERVVSLSYSETEILVALGLQDKIVGIAEADNSSEVVSEEYRSMVESLNVIAETEDGGVPTLEVVLSQSPDFVYGTAYSFNSSYGVGDVADFEANDIKIYASTSTYKSDSTIEDTYNDILNIGRIFRVEDRAEELVAEMRTKIDAIAEKVANEDPISVFIYDSGDSSAYTFYGNSYEGSLVALAGGENVFTENENGGGMVGWEAVVAANPEFIVVNDWGGGEGAAPIEEKINFIKAQPELQEVTAVKEDNFVVVHLEQASFGGLQNTVAVETIAKALHPGCFE